MNPIYLPSASALKRRKCISSYLLPRVEYLPEQDQEEGNTMHEFLRHIGAEGPDARQAALDAIADDDPAKQLAHDFDVTLIPRGGDHEVAMAWNPDTGEGRVLGHDIKRRYVEHGADLAREFVGSTDYGGKLADNRALVIDYKRSWQIDSARNSEQLHMLAVMEAAIVGADEVVAAHLILRGEKPRWDIAEYDSMMLAGFRSDFRDLAADLRRRQPIEDLEHANVVENPHCRYCPAFSRCPAKIGLVRNLPIFDKRPLQLGLGEAEMAAAWQAVQKVKGILKRLEKEIEGYARDKPLNLGETELKLAPGDPREKVTDAASVMRFLATHYDEQTGLGAIGMTKSAITESVKDWARRTGAPVGTTAERALTVLREAGLLTKEPGEVKVREVRRLPVLPQKRGY